MQAKAAPDRYSIEEFANLRARVPYVHTWLTRLHT